MTRLADVTRPVGQAFFTPIIRPRILQRIDAAAAGQIVLIVAPAGYGKSLALTQWLASRPEDSLRFDVQPEHDTLLGFARGMAEACAPASPSLVKTVTTAAKSSASAESPGMEMARWMAANLEKFDGFIAIDDFQRTGDDPEVSRFVSELIARTKRHLKWVIATRSTLDLPVASWLGYGDVHFVVGERDLVFSDDETQTLSAGAGEPLAPNTLRTLMDVTAGWPVALGLAMRSPALLSGEAALSNATRDVVFEYLAEQVYADLRGEERELLHFACYLPAIESDVLEAAGYQEWAPVLEAVRRRATFLTLERPGVYKCHDLFREFLQRQIETSDPVAARRLQTSAAAALEVSGNIAAALRLHTKLDASEHILRLLHEHGFGLMDHSHGDLVEAAIARLPQVLRTSDAAVLGLRAQREADFGRFARAEPLFNKAMRAADLAGRGDLGVRLALSLALLLRNEDRRVSDLLVPVLQSSAGRKCETEIAALLAVDCALAGEREQALEWLSAVNLVALDAADEIQAKVLLRLGTAGMVLGLEQSGVFSNLSQAASLAEQIGMLATAARAFITLGTAQLLYLADYAMASATLAQAVEVASKSGDRLSLHSTIAYALSVEINLGNEKAVEDLIWRFKESATSDARRHRLVLGDAQATLAAWRGDFAEAARFMELSAAEGYGYYNYDKLFSRARHMLYLVCAGKTITTEARANISAGLINTRTPYLYSTEKKGIAALLFALAESCAGNNQYALHMLKRFHPLFAGRMEVVLDIIERAIAFPASGSLNSETVSVIGSLGYPGLARTIGACASKLSEASGSRVFNDNVRLTDSERAVLIALDEGLSPKEIAFQTHRSLHTVRTLIQRAVQKLGCHGRHDALKLAKQRRLLCDPRKEPLS